MLALKLTIVPLLIAAITFAGHRWGPAVSGWLAGLPVVSGPVLLFIAIEQGPSFAATASIGTLAGVLAAVSFAIVYAWSPCALPGRRVWRAAWLRILPSWPRST